MESSSAASANVNIIDMSNISGFVSEVIPSLRWRECAHMHGNTISTNNQNKFCICKVSWGGKYVCAVLIFFSNWLWQTPDLATCAAGCFRSCNYHFSSSCLFYAFNRHTDGLNHCQTTAQPDWPQPFWTVGRAFGWLEGQTDTQRAWNSDCIMIHGVIFVIF